MNSDNIICFGSFGVEHIPYKSQKLRRNKIIKANIYKIQASNSMMGGYLCIGFIFFMLEGKSLLDYTNLFSLSKYERNDILKRLKLKTSSVLVMASIKNLKNLKYHLFSKKH